jgi:hypothetical protein
MPSAVRLRTDFTAGELRRLAKDLCRPLALAAAVTAERSLSGQNRFNAATAIGVFLIGWAAPAAAYRPFDGTDAAVADLGEVEIELQPAGVLYAGSSTTLAGPNAVYTYGARDRFYKKFQLYHVNLKYFPGRLDYYLAHHALCVGRHLISRRIEDPIRWY